MKKIALIYIPLFLLALAFMLFAWYVHNDKQVSISIGVLILLVAGFIGSVIGEKRNNRLPSAAIKRLVVLFLCAIAAILIGYLTDLLTIGCIASFILGCIALIGLYRTSSQI